jgi:8-oxo-dGTP pyrophosphatase MutT (NUDIX family)
MKIKEIDNDSEHREQLAKTGFRGRRGAGCLFQAQDTGKICIAHRSNYVEQPSTWGSWGGAIDGNESPETAARREVREEAAPQTSAINTNNNNKCQTISAVLA